MRAAGAPSPGERILVRLPNWLGDALMARPFLLALRAARPDATILAVGPAALLELLAGDLAWDAAEPWVPAGPPHAALLARVRAFGPELAFVLPPSFSSAWFAWRSGAKMRVGFRGEWRDALLTRAHARPERGERHLSREYLALGEGFSLSEAPFRPLPPPDGDPGPAAVLRDALVLAPGAAYGPAKRWAAERFVAVGQRALAAGIAVAVCGAVEDRAIADAVAAGIGQAAHALAGRTTLAEVAAALPFARAVLSNDSGFAHLAAALGAPTVVVFGSTSSAWTAPLGDATILQHPPVCSPCFQRRCAIGYRCLAAVSREEASQALAPWLAAPVAMRGRSA